ncbi:uncharacterized protein LOC144587737 isoform X2 [Pogona vitticeps]
MPHQLMLDHLQKERSQQPVQETPANQQRTILDFLSAVDEVQKSTKLQLLPKSREHQAYTKMFGKSIKKDGLGEGQASPLFSQEEGVAESKKSILKIQPLSVKNFRKAAPHSTKKSKKRACFWKYCVQRK